MADPPPRRRTRRTWRPRPSALVATGRQAGVHVPLRGGRSFATHHDFQLQLDHWLDHRAKGRRHDAALLPD